MSGCSVSYDVTYGGLESAYFYWNPDTRMLGFQDLSESLATSTTTVVLPYEVTYTLILKATLITATGTTIEHSENFSLDVKNPCVDNDLNWINIPAVTLPETVYKINSGEKVVSVSSLFSVEN